MSNTSFDKIIDTVFAGFKKITPALVAMAIVSGSVLFLPATILRKLGLRNLPEPIKTIIGMMFLLSIALVLIILCSFIYQKTMKIVMHKRRLYNLKKCYTELSSKHKKIIVELLNSSSKSIELDSLSGDTIYLIEHNFIHRPQQVVDDISLYDNKYSYIPQLWLMDLYEKKPELFDLNL